MSRLILGTATVGMDEPIWSLKEVNGPGPGCHGVHRYQVLRVARGPDPARWPEFRRDLGPAAAFTTDEFYVPGGVEDGRTGKVYVEHTVGELVEVAEYLRSDRYERPERPKPTDLVTLYRELPEKRHVDRVKRSTFARLVKVQRD